MLVYPVLDQGEIRRMILGLLVFIPVILATFRLSAIKAWVWPAVLPMSGAFFFSVLSTIHHSTTPTGIKWAFLNVSFGLTLSGVFSYFKNARTISDFAPLHRDQYLPVVGIAVVCPLQRYRCFLSRRNPAQPRHIGPIVPASCCISAWSLSRPSATFSILQSPWLSGWAPTGRATMGARAFSKLL